MAIETTLKVIKVTLDKEQIHAALEDEARKEAGYRVGSGALKVESDGYGGMAFYFEKAETPNA